MPPSDKPTVVLGLEVLDNLPHDKVRSRPSRAIEQAEIQQSRQNPEVLEEIFAPLSDVLLSRVLNVVPSYVQAHPTWVPTVACGMLECIGNQRPNSSIVLADFDWLPAPELSSASISARLSTWAEGEPIVTDMDGVDHCCYLTSPRYCDILFPTDFEKLASFVKRTRKGSESFETILHVEKQAEFLERYGKEQVMATKSWLTGHTPLLHDFTNCSVLTVTTRRKK